MSERQEFAVGDSVRIWSGRNEGFGSSVKEVRQSASGWEYLTSYGWQSGGNLVAATDRRGWHYDSAGYCDNPGRGY